MKIAGIIVNYRTAELTAQSSNALLTDLARVGSFHLFVVDNDSRDGSYESLAAAAKRDGWAGRATIIAAPRNGGYGYGINLAVRRALALPDPPDYIYALNSDAFCTPEALPRLVQFMDEHPDAGIAGSRIQYPDGTLQAAAFRFPSIANEIEHLAGIGLLSRAFAQRVVPMPLPSESQPVDWVPGTSMLVRRAVFEQVGLFDEGFFLYFEETDFCRRAGQAGWKTYFVASAEINHLESVSTGMLDETRRMPQYWFDSRHRYFIKHHGRMYALACDGASLAGHVIGRTKRHLLRRPPEGRPHIVRDLMHSTLRNVVLAKPGEFDDRGQGLAPDAPDAGATTRDSASKMHSHGKGNGVDTRSAKEMSLLELLAEDFATYGRDLAEPGLWAVMTHRIGSRIAAIPNGATRGILDLIYRTAFTGVDWVWGIHLPRSVELGRRVRLWHNGGMLLRARSIGNDVHIRHDTTFGPLRDSGADGSEALPVIEDRADIGSGACVMGGVAVGHDAVIGANSVVLKAVAPHSTVLGVPARPIPT
jgi:N-acetylglucosaminyl-diphospho-decaprenol L-rhamnosyltransferase